MNKEEFLEQLEERLVGIPKEDKREILQDYEEHFRVGKKKKRTEEEIAKSLGDPKEIAGEIRRELSGRKEGEELKAEAIETWVTLKRFSRHVFNETKDKIDEVSEKFDPGKVSHWILLALGIILFFMLVSVIAGGLFIPVTLIILIFIVIEIVNKRRSGRSASNARKSSGRRDKKKEYEERSVLKTTLVLLFNILIFIWVWIALFSVIIAFIIAGVAMVISGLLVSIFSVFSLINYPGPELSDLFFSGLFAGLGILMLGVLFTILFNKLIKVFFRLTKRYLKLNQEMIRK